MVYKLNLMKKEKKIETGTETIVGDVVGHQDGGEVPAVDESVCMGLYQNQLWVSNVWTSGMCQDPARQAPVTIISPICISCHHLLRP